MMNYFNLTMLNINFISLEVSKVAIYKLLFKKYFLKKYNMAPIFANESLSYFNFLKKIFTLYLQFN